MSFPSVIVTLTNPTSSDHLNSPSHSGIETAQNNEIIQIENVIGTSSSVLGTIIGDLRNINSGGGGHIQTANKGGTGQTSFVKGDLLVASSTSVISKLTLGSDGAVLTADSTQSAGVKWGSSGNLNYFRWGTDWSATGRALSGAGDTGGSGAVTYDTFGGTLTTGATGTSYAGVREYIDPASSGQGINGTPTFGCNLCIPTVGTTGSSFFGLGNITRAGTALDYTSKHVGFKILIAASTASLYATQADGTETASAALTTVTANDSLELCVLVGSTSADYYWRKNGGTWSTKTTLSANLPLATDTNVGLRIFQGLLSNSATASSTAISIPSAFYQR